MDTQEDGGEDRLIEMIRPEPKELFCKAFDLSCFEVEDPPGCKRGKAAVIGNIYFYTLSVEALCPLCDRLK